jgi:flagellar biosynthetic protein FlhB
MAEESKEDRSREDLTEEASPYRIEEFRRKGIVAQSRELSSLVGLLGVFVMVYMMAPQIIRDLSEFMREMFSVENNARQDFAQSHSFKELLSKTLNIILTIGLPICLVGFVVGALTSFSQIGSIFSTDPIQPDLSKLNPTQGLKKLFSLKLVSDGLRLIFKMSAVLLVAYFAVKYQILTSASLVGADPFHTLMGYGTVSKTIFFALMGVLTVFAALDFWVNRFEYSKKVKMTKQEAKQEYKEREGDPQIKARIRSIQREVARRRMMQAVKKADVLVTNPTHIAIAIVYEKDKMLAPKVIAKGADLIAQKMKQIAKDAGVPLVENVPLARTLFKSVKIGQYVPRNLYQAVAEILAFVYKLRKKDRI